MLNFMFIHMNMLKRWQHDVHCKIPFFSLKPLETLFGSGSTQSKTITVHLSTGASARVENVSVGVKNYPGA